MAERQPGAAVAHLPDGHGRGHRQNGADMLPATAAGVSADDR